MTLAVKCLARGHFDPSFADAVLLHVLAFVVVQADADFMLERGGYVIAAARIRRQAVGQWRTLKGIGHGVPWVLECSININFIAKLRSWSGGAGRCADR